MNRCPCGSGASLQACCGPIIDGRPAPTAEALMRSRYTAFALRDLDHIERTQAGGVRGSFDRPAAEAAARAVEWVGLEILGTSGGGVADATGTVEFAARCIRDGRPHLLHEISIFRREQGRWVYVDRLDGPGARPPGKIGRNDPCPCGSGKKYKRCCGA